MPQNEDMGGIKIVDVNARNVVFHSGEVVRIACYYVTDDSLPVNALNQEKALIPAGLAANTNNLFCVGLTVSIIL